MKRMVRSFGSTAFRRCTPRCLSLFLILGMAFALGCRSRQRVATAPDPPPPDEQLVISDPMPLPVASAEVPGAELLAPAGDEDCVALCERLLSFEVATLKAAIPDRIPASIEDEEARELVAEVESLLTGLADRRVPPCVQRCRGTFSKAVSACVLASDGVSAAVDCLARSGAADK